MVLAYLGLAIFFMAIISETSFIARTALIILSLASLLRILSLIRVYKNGWDRGILPLIIPSALITLFGFFFFLLFGVFTSRDFGLPQNMLAVIGILAGLFVVGSLSILVSISRVKRLNK